MQVKRYICDGGTIAIECGGSIIRYEALCGDGNGEVILFKDEKEFEEYRSSRNVHQLAYNRFKNANVLSCDCDDEARDDNVLFTLNGYYNIYRHGSTIALVRDDD